ncbi:MAG: APC family permease [Streptosporangiaceae bacterium]
MTVRDATPHPPAAEDQEDKHRLTALEGLAALSLDALSSVAYGPEAIVIVLAAAGAAGLCYTVPITIAIVVLLAVLVISYRQVIEAFPSGDGAYAVAKRHLGRNASLLAGASLTVDYVLNAAVGVSAGVEAFTSAFPRLYPDRVWICLGVLAIITAANMWGVAESARLFIVPTLVFILSIAIVIVGGLIRSHPVVPLSGHLPAVAQSVGILLLLKAFASGCSALTGVEAIANAVPQFRQPRVRRAQHTEMMLGIILGLMLIGIAGADPQVPRHPVTDRDDAGPADRGRRGTQHPLLRDPADHDRPAGAGREHLLRRPARPGQPAGPRQFPVACVRAER